MFSWFRRKPEPAPPTGQAQDQAQPDFGMKVQVGFANAQKSWSEEVNLIQTAGRVLNQIGHPTTADEDSLTLSGSGFVIRPRLLEFFPLDQGGVRTVTTIETSHPDLITERLFEYQHSAGNNLEESIAKGFDQWARVDLVPLLEASRPKPESCMMLGMSFPEKDGQPARHRRAILGPVAHLRSEPPREGAEAEEHPFCPCCLLTRSFEAFKDLMESDRFVGIRLFASRDQNGRPQADCRVNGEDWEPGAEALRQYAKTWPKAGFEFRKQYVVLQSAPAPEPAPEPEPEPT